MKRLILIISFLLCGLAFANPPGTFQPLLLASTTSTPITISQTAAANADTNFASLTNAAISTAATNRDVVVAITYRAGGAVTTSGVTIGGNAATAIVQSNNAGAGNTMRCELWGLRVTTGTTATVAVSTSASVARYSIVVFAMYGASAVTSPNATNTTNGTTLAIPASGGAIACAGDNAGATSASWSGLTEATDTFTGGAMVATTAKDAFASATSPTITVTLTSANLPVYAKASWGPP